LVANMVKSNADLTSPEIINSVCTDFLNLKPEIMGQVSFDPAIEAAVNHMTMLPLNSKKSQAAGDLAQIALRIIQETMWRPQVETAEERQVKPQVEPQVESLISQPSLTS